MTTAIQAHTAPSITAIEALASALTIPGADHADRAAELRELLNGIMRAAADALSALALTDSEGGEA